MDECDRHHIRIHLGQLTQDTICNTELYTNLLQQDALTQNEIDIIDSKSTPIGKANHLYRIIQTKVNSKERLIKALEATKQTGAVKILKVPERATRRIQDQIEQQNSNETKKLKSCHQRIVFQVRNPSHLFTGRSAELEKLREICTNTVQPYRVTIISQIMSVNGLGGVGKTQIAREFVRQESNRFDVIAWMNAETEETLSKCFRTLATEKLNINSFDSDGSRKSITVIVEDVYQALHEQRVLMVFDNAEKGDYLEKFFPIFSDVNQCSIVPMQILITSREKDWGLDNTRVLTLQGLQFEDAIEFVKKGLGILNPSLDTVQSIKNLVLKLDCFPLTIQQALAYINEEKKQNIEISISDYIAELEKNKKQVLNQSIKGPFCDYQLTTYSTWKVTLQKIAQDKIHGPTAIHILNCIAFMAPDNIDRSIFLPLVPGKNKRDLNRSVALLVNFSMLNEDKQQSLLSVHRLVQQVVRLNLDDMQQSERLVLDSLLPLLQRQDENRRFKQIDHALRVWSFASYFPELVTKYSRVPYYITEEIAQFEHSRLEVAKTFATTELEVLHKCLSSKHESTLMLQTQLCRVQYLQGELNSCCESATLLIKEWDRAGIKPSIYTVECEQLLANIFFDQGKIHDAFRLYKSLLLKRKQLQNWTSIKTGWNIYYLGYCSLWMGKYDAALQYFNTALELFTSLSGPDSEEAATTIQQISKVEMEIGDFDKGMQTLKGLLSKSFSDDLRSKVFHQCLLSTSLLDKDKIKI